MSENETQRCIRGRDHDHTYFWKSRSESECSSSSSSSSDTDTSESSFNFVNSIDKCELDFSDTNTTENPEKGKLPCFFSKALKNACSQTVNSTIQQPKQAKSSIEKCVLDFSDKNTTGHPEKGKPSRFVLKAGKNACTQTVNSPVQQLKQAKNSIEKCVLNSSDFSDKNTTECSEREKPSRFVSKAKKNARTKAANSPVQQAEQAKKSVVKFKFDSPNASDTETAESNDSFDLQAACKTENVQQLDSCPVPANNSDCLATAGNTVSFGWLSQLSAETVVKEEPIDESSFENELTEVPIEPDPVLSLRIESVRSDPDSKLWQKESEFQPQQDYSLQNDCYIGEAGLPSELYSEAIKVETDEKETDVQINFQKETGLPNEFEHGDIEMDLAGNSALDDKDKSELQNKSTDQFEEGVASDNFCLKVEEPGLPDEDSEIFDMVAKDVENSLKSVNKSEKPDRWINPQSLSFLNNL